jgi:hypothetical protein
MDWLNLAIRLAAVVGVTFVVTFAWAVASRKLAFLDKPYRLSESSGTIRPWPPIWVVMGIFLALVTLGGLGAAWANPTTGMVVTMAICVAIVGPLAFCGLILATPASYLTWDERGVDGPISSFWPSRRNIAWSAIAKAKVNLGGSYFIENDRGDRIFWSSAHVGQMYFWNVLVNKRPDLLEQAKQALRPNV